MGSAGEEERGEKVKAISLWEPWATAIAIGAKKIETRSWSTRYRGPLAIHAANTKDHAEFVWTPGVARAFQQHGILKPGDLSFGCVVATCTLAQCFRTEAVRDEISDLERALGGYDNGRFAWVLKDVVRLPIALPAKGSQGFWDWTPPD